MRRLAIPLAAVVSLVVVAVVLMAVSSPPQVSRHDADLRDCIERYGVSQYAEADSRAFHPGMVAACMRGRGY